MYKLHLNMLHLYKTQCICSPSQSALQCWVPTIYLELVDTCFQIHLHQSSSSEVEDVEMRGRVFLLLVGLDGVLVGLVMEGCGLTDEATPTLDPAYVTEAKQLIAKLDLQDVFDSNSSGRCVC